MKELKSKLIERITKNITETGFKLIKGKGWYIRGDGDITEKFWVVFYDTPLGYRVVPSVAIRIEQIEKVFHLSSNFEKKYQKHTSTIESEIWRWQGDQDKYQYNLEVDEDIDLVVANLLCDFNGLCQEFYENYSSIDAVDALLNDDPEQNSVFQLLDYSRCSHGVIVAKLNGRKNYTEVATIYANRMKSVNKGFYYKWFGPLLEILDEM
ncbi:MAG: hypothetical protein GY707_01560 [Desulfobacteraceae bacterium]|nr:hypothetical protein [Desulfobacteraceae bacterium]